MLMNSPIFSDGKEYISASRASKKIGYASDYIGQLCRAKKIPGRLIGRTWYIDFTALLEYKESRKSGKKGKTGDGSTQTSEIKKIVLSYDQEKFLLLPPLSKKKRYLEPVWTTRILKEAVTISLLLILATSAGLFLFERTSSSIITEVREKIEDTFNTTSSQLATALTTASVLDSIDKFFENIVAGLSRLGGGFRSLKEIALRKIFLAVKSPVQPEVPKDTPVAVTSLTQSLNLESLKSELKEELENYIRVQINSVRSPVVVYSSSPALATTDLEFFKTNEVIPAIYYSVTNQSDSDVDNLSSKLARLTDGGTFINATISGSTFSGPKADFSSLTFTNATGTNATTTNFFSTTASSTNLFSSLLTVGGTGLVVDSSRNVGIGTTSPSDTLAINGAVYLASISVPPVTASRIYNAGGDLYWAGNVIGGSTTGTWTTDGTNVWRAGGNVGIGTTTPTWLLNPTSATASQLALSAGAGFSQWAFRNAGGNLYFATTTVAGTATSTTAALSINANGLQIGRAHV